MGWPHKFLWLIAAIELVGTGLYAIPLTSLLGALAMTALLGGAVATHLRVESPLYSHTLFGVYLGPVMWGGLWLRNPKLRELTAMTQSVPLLQTHLKSEVY